VDKQKLEWYYDIYFGETPVGNTVVLPKVKNKTEEELVVQLAQSITAEIERLDKREEKCKNKKK
jgi:hypothetical protein